MMSAPEEFGKKFISGSFWTMARLMGRQIIQSFAFFAFAYLMSPENFGIAAMATSLGFLGRLIVERGTIDRVVQMDQHSEASLSTLFWLSIFFGILVALLLCAIGIIISTANPALGSPLPFLASALIPLIVAPGQIHEGLIRREFGFRELAKIQMISSSASVLISLALLYAGSDIWAVISFMILESALKTFFVCMIKPWSPTRRISVPEARHHFHFSFAVILGALLTVGNLRIIEIVLGIVLGPADAGFFRLGVQVNRLLTQALRTPVNNMMLPSFSRISSMHTKASKLLDISSISALTCFPFYVLAAVGSPYLFEIVMGSEWRQAGVVAQWVCLGIYAQLLPPIINPVVISIGKPGEATKMALVIFLSSLISSVSGAILYGLEGATIGIAAATIIILPYTLFFSERNLPITARSILESIATPAISSIAAYIISAATLYFLQPVGVINLLLSLAIGAIVYVFSVYFLSITIDQRQRARISAIKKILLRKK